MLKFQKAFDNSSQNEEQNTPQKVVYHKSISGFPYDIEFPVIDMETADRAVLEWFNSQNPLYLETALGRNKVPAIFSSAERFAMMNADKNIALRDRNGTLKLPIISVRREESNLLPARNVPTDEFNSTNITLYVRPYTDPITNEKKYRLSFNGNVLPTDAERSVVEKIEIQTPTLTEAKYTINFWSKFFQHLNMFQEHILRWFGQFHVVYASEKLYFRAILDSNSMEVNDESLNDSEKIVKCSANITVTVPLINEDMIRSRVGIQKLNIDFKTEEVIDAQEAEKRIVLLGGWDDNPYQISNFDRERKVITPWISPPKS